LEHKKDPAFNPDKKKLVNKLLLLMLGLVQPIRPKSLQGPYTFDLEHRMPQQALNAILKDT